MVSFPTRDLTRNWLKVPNDWKCKIRKESSQKSICKTLCFNKSVTRKVKDLQNLFNKEIHETLQSDTTKHRPFRFISWSNFIEEFKNLSPGIGSILIADLKIFLFVLVYI